MILSVCLQRLSRPPLLRRSSKSSCNNICFWFPVLVLKVDFDDKIMSSWSGWSHLQRCVIVDVLVSALSRRLPSNHLVYMMMIWWQFDDNFMIWIWGPPHVRPSYSHAPGQWWEGAEVFLALRADRRKPSGPGGFMMMLMITKMLMMMIIMVIDLVVAVVGSKYPGRSLARSTCTGWSTYSWMWVDMMMRKKNI